MSKYEQGKIYKIISNQTQLVYIGSTVEKYLTVRLAKHKSEYRKWQEGKKSFCSSYDILKFDDATIILLEMHPCKSKDELRAKEQHYIDLFDCVNKKNAYGEDHEKEKARANKFYAKNKDNNEFMEVRRLRARQYADENRDMINEKKRVKVNCPCGGTCALSSKARHEKTILHQNYIKSLD